MRHTVDVAVKAQGSGTLLNVAPVAVFERMGWRS
jgi:hypothetical protein